jgi:hypothetical protein
MTSAQTTEFNSIKRDAVYAEFYVCTKWDQRLEFVLLQAEENNPRFKMYSSGKYPVTYSEILKDMLDVEFLNDKFSRVHDYNVYGEVYFKVRAENYTELDAVLKRCDKVVTKWINKYRINSMKDC